MSTPHTDIPLVHSTLDTVATEGPREILTHNVNCLLRYLHELEGNCSSANEGLHDYMHIIEREIADLQDYLRSKEVPEMLPPVLCKERSVEGSSIISTAPPTLLSRRLPLSVPIGPCSAVETPSLHASPRPTPRLVPIPLTLPPFHMASPSSLSSSMSFLSSHHSDEFSLMESEPYGI